MKKIAFVLTLLFNASVFAQGPYCPLRLAVQYAANDNTIISTPCTEGYSPAIAALDTHNLYKCVGVAYVISGGYAITGGGTPDTVPIWGGTGGDLADSGIRWFAGGGTPYIAVDAYLLEMYSGSSSSFVMGVDTNHALKIARDVSTGVVTFTTGSGSPTGSFAFGRAVAVTGALSATGAVTGSNLSGTNTGDNPPSDTAYAGSWDGVTTIAPSKNSVYDKIEAVVAAIPSAPSDTAYDATSWNGVTTIAPSKNAVRDKIETMPATADPSGPIGLTVVNGTSGNCMRNDGLPPLSQAIAPTWTQVHTFSALPVFSAGINLSTSGLIQSDVANSGTNVGALVRDSVSLTASRRTFEVDWYTGSAYQEMFGLWSQAGSQKGMQLSYNSTTYLRALVNSAGNATFTAVGTAPVLQFTSTGGGVGNVGFTADTGITFSGGTSATFNVDLKLTNAGNGLYVKEGTNATMGRATLVAGTVVVSTTKVTAVSEIFITIQSLGTVAIPCAEGVTARTATTSFTITSACPTDTSVIAWQIVEPS